jgi:hypothetical protein
MNRIHSQEFRCLNVSDEESAIVSHNENLTVALEIGFGLSHRAVKPRYLLK